MRIFSLLIFLSFITIIHGQKTVIDTVETEYGKILVYSNNTWAYLEDIEFDGVMNKILQAELDARPELKLKQSWEHEVCFTSGLKNDISALQDSIWICVEEDDHADFVVPNGGIITSPFGWRKGRNHNGVDIDLNTGDTVCAAWSGKVRYAMYNESGFGNLVIIRHENGLETLYAHLSKHLVTPNQEIKAGDPIGLGGNTGHSYGSHLHFEVRFYDIAIDPQKIIDFAAKEVKDENLFIHKGLFRPGTGTTSPSSSNGEALAATEASKTYYRIKSGDTLSDIARRHKTTVSKICQLNGIRPTTTLQVGRSLRVK